MRRALWAITITACASSEPSPPPSEPSPPSPPPPSPAPSPVARRWIAGDLHMHVAPIDAREGQRLDVAGLAREGRAAGLEFVIATPHVHRSTWNDRAKRRDWLARWSAMARAARERSDLTIIPGVEYTVWGYGHFGVSGVDLAALAGDADDFLASATTRGAFVVVNHPFAVPTNIPGVAISDRDLSFRPWTDSRGAMPHLDGVEVWNLPLALANLASRPGGFTGEQRAFAAADRLARRERRRVTVVGGSDSHTAFMTPTTWVLASDPGEPAILAGLRAGATCVGGIEGGTLEARGDGDPADRWARIGDAVIARSRVELRWTGAARVFVDGADAGEHRDRFVHDRATGVHTYRIEIGSSRCGFVYANL